MPAEPTLGTSETTPSEPPVISEDAPTETAALDAALERQLATFGELDPEPWFRLRPEIIDDTVVPWPANAIGRLRLVRRETGLLFVTQGMSYPFNDLHADGPEPLGCELAIEVAYDEPVAPGRERAFRDLSGDELATSWPARFLWFLADSWIYERWPVVPRLDHFGMITSTATPPPELRGYALANGAVGFLVGAPIEGGETRSPARIVTIQPLVPAEYEWVTGVPDSSRVLVLSERMRAAGLAHRASAVREALPLGSR